MIPTLAVKSSQSRSGFIQRHPVVTYYGVTFAISWGGIGFALGIDGVPRDPTQLAKTIPIMVVAMLAGPGIACISVTGMSDGRQGYGDLLSRLLRWRVSIGFYAAALLIAPLLLAVVPLALSLRFADLVPRILTDSNKHSILAMGFIVGPAVGFLEELGWTGFVIPRLRRKFGLFNTAGIVGLLWGLWHVPVNICSSLTPSGRISVTGLAGTLVFSFGLLPAFRILMVWVWDCTASLPLAMLMHFSLTASNIILGPSATPGILAVIFNLVLAGAMWMVAAASMRVVQS